LTKEAAAVVVELEAEKKVKRKVARGDDF